MDLLAVSQGRNYDAVQDTKFFTHLWRFLQDSIKYSKICSAEKKNPLQNTSTSMIQVLLSTVILWSLNLHVQIRHTETTRNHLYGKVRAFYFLLFGGWVFVARIHENTLIQSHGFHLTLEFSGQFQLNLTMEQQSQHFKFHDNNRLRDKRNVRNRLSIGTAAECPHQLSGWTQHLLPLTLIFRWPGRDPKHNGGNKGA